MASLVKMLGELRHQHGKREEEQHDRGDPEHDVCLADGRRNANPARTDDVQDLGKDEAPDSELAPEAMRGVARGRGRNLRFSFHRRPLVFLIVHSSCPDDRHRQCA